LWNGPAKKIKTVSLGILIKKINYAILSMNKLKVTY
jgi:hypothetical protein